MREPFTSCPRNPRAKLVSMSLTGLALGLAYTLSRASLLPSLSPQEAGDVPAHHLRWLRGWNMRSRKSTCSQNTGIGAKCLP